MDAISEYQKWKQQGESLRAQAKQAMEAKFRELLVEAAQIGQEYQRDFGAALKLPMPITAFRYKSGARQKNSKPAALPVALKGVQPNRKVAALQKRRTQIQKNLEASKSAGKATRNLEDKLYEIEDELRLAGATPQ